MKFFKTLFNTALLMSLTLVSWSVSYAQVSEVESALIQYVDDHNEEALELLIRTININSGSMNFEGVREVGRVLAEEFEKLDFDTQLTDGSAYNRAGHLIATYKGKNAKKKLLLIGHLDTVFEPDSPFQEFKMINDTTASGPGIADMKGGNVIILQALGALKANGLLEDLDITVVMTGDEELSGSPLELSKKALVDAAIYADIAIGFENGDGNPGTANVSRRGSIGWTLNVTGQPAHSSQIFQDKVGAGAIYEASRILYSFYNELRIEEYLTFNPGNILGGTTVVHDMSANKGTAFGKDNVVAETAVVTGDIRALSKEQLARVKLKMQEIVADNMPRTTAKLTFDEGYPPMAPTEGNKELLAIYNQLSKDLGYGEVVAVNPIFAGAADVSFTADHVDMAIDALGMSGADDHTVDEIGYLNKLPVQSKRAAVLLYRLSLMD